MKLKNTNIQNEASNSLYDVKFVLNDVEKGIGKRTDRTSIELHDGRGLLRSPKVRFAMSITSQLCYVSFFSRNENILVLHFPVVSEFHC